MSVTNESQALAHNYAYTDVWCNNVADAAIQQQADVNESRLKLYTTD